MPHYNVNPTDSALFANGFSVARHHEAAWADETKRIRRVRGEVLSAMFEVEATIDYAIADLILPRCRSLRIPRWVEDRHLLLQNHVLTHFDLRTKIETLASLLNARFPNQRSSITAVRSKLDAVRSVRNRMAHSPVYFEALAKQSYGRWLRPHLMTADGLIHLSDGYLRGFKRDVVDALDLLKSIMREGLRVRRRRIEEVEAAPTATPDHRPTPVRNGRRPRRKRRAAVQNDDTPQAS